MIFVNTAYKREVTLRRVAQHVTCSDRVSEVRDEGEFRVVYLGDGYWRCALHEHFARESGPTESHVFALRLINPDRTEQELRTVEKGLAVLLGPGFRYQ